MSKKWKIYLNVSILLTSIAAAFFLGSNHNVTGSGGHNFEGICSKCHLSEPKPNKKLLFTKDIDMLCEECHKQEKASLSHPSGIKPSFSLPEGMPLDWTGKMTCATCHKIHVNNNKYLLITGKTGKTFCVQCHQTSLYKEGKYGHEVVESTLHQPKYEIKNINQTLDIQSIDCIACHDGTFDRHQYVTVGTGIWNHGYSIGVSHPIGVDYSKSAAKGGYKPAGVLNKKIRFFNGKLGCGTCHNLYSKIPHKLVMSNKGSALCLECHIK